VTFDIFHIELTKDEALLCAETACLWGDVPTVRPGKNALKKPEWSRVMMSLEQVQVLAGASLPRKKAAGMLAGRIYAATETRKGCDVTQVTEADPHPVVAAVVVVEKQRTMFD
jgi:hypothetical protein